MDTVNRPNQTTTLYAVPALLVAAVAFLLFALTCSQAGAQEVGDDIPLAPRMIGGSETYRLRVENREYGRVALSADGGQHYTLIGRVTRPASTVALDRAATAPAQIIRSGGDGLAFAVNLGQSLKLRPATLSASGVRRGQAVPASGEPFAIVTNLAPRAGLFGELLPPAGAQVKLENDGSFQHGFPTPYEPSKEDAYVFIVTEQAKGDKTMNRAAPDIRGRIAALGQAYTAQSIARARQEHRALVSGVLHLQARLPEGEPDPIEYVEYIVDGRSVSQQNVKPFSYDWDTRRAEDGEHVVEVRALNRNLRAVTYKRALVVVQNKNN